jgi:hypothetical protein
MEDQETIVNRVAQSPLITFDLEDYYHRGERILFDMKDFLYNEMILKEKEFRDKISAVNWDYYKDKNVAVTCSVDAIIPTWAFMLIASKLSPIAHLVIFGNIPMLENALFFNSLKKVNPEEFRDKKVIVKGCGKFPVPEYAYVEITRLLTPVVSSLMYGEACSTVPVFKRK